MFVIWKGQNLVLLFVAMARGLAVGREKSAAAVTSPQKVLTGCPAASVTARPLPGSFGDSDYSGRASVAITVSWRQAGRAALSSSARPDWRQVTGWIYPKETADVSCASGSCGSRWRETLRRSSGSRGMRALPRINRPGSQSLRTVAN